MRRRTVLTSLGVLAAGGAVGSGAFTTAEAERTVDVAIADEDEALLALEPESDFAIPTQDWERIRLDFDQSVNFDPGPDGEGLSSASEYAFDGVFRVSNQGTQTLYLESEFEEVEGSEGVEVAFYVDTNDDTPLDGDEDNGAVLEIDAGHSALIGTKISVSDEVETGVEEGNATIAVPFEFVATISTTDEEPSGVTVLDSDGE